ncbi:MAG: hypothetical protein ACD_80C00180G0007 [uncultured bacterium (gcode 4)]|uniref:Uncharacterized protein n=1 Tax=uncultured bacterium (gcode 4) TaxID=1234023 RepID=K1XW60_9BACT|nr:MAG: hypothetical protein ACD_80C00180G0007 [uncultured bacterium (gcode 4)]
MVFFMQSITFFSFFLSFRPNKVSGEIALHCFHFKLIYVIKGFLDFARNDK